MAERGSRSGASDASAYSNVGNILDEDFGGRTPRTLEEANLISATLRKELRSKGLRGFKRGGKVKKTGVAKVHKGERVLTAKQAKTYAKAAPKAAPKRVAVSRRVVPQRGKRK